jgi:hypothetical protein
MAWNYVGHLNGRRQGLEAVGVDGASSFGIARVIAGDKTSAAMASFLLEAVLRACRRAGLELVTATTEWPAAIPPSSPVDAALAMVTCGDRRATAAAQGRRCPPARRALGQHVAQPEPAFAHLAGAPPTTGHL